MRVAELQVPFAPMGLAINQRWLAIASAGNSALSVFSARDLKLIRTIPLGYPMGVVFVPPDDVVLVADRFPGEGLTAFHLHEGHRRFHADVAGNQIVVSSLGTTFYLNGVYSGAFRVSSQGAVDASFGVDQYRISAMALSRDDESLLVVPNPGNIAVLLHASNLQPRLSLDLPLRAEVAVPLVDPNRWLILGKPAGAQLDGPLLVYVIDTDTHQVRELARFSQDGLPLLFGTANPWAETQSGRTVVVPTTFGLVQVNLQREQAELMPPEELGGSAPCCEVAYDPVGSRLLLTQGLGPGAEMGRVLVFQQGHK